LPLVATNEAFFFARDDYDAHDALIAKPSSVMPRQSPPPVAR
jgi:hypothetical protein